MLNKLLFAISGLLLIYCLKPNKSECIEKNLPKCNINYLTRNNKCRSIMDIYRDQSVNRILNEEIYKIDTLQFHLFVPHLYPLYKPL